MPGTKAHRPQPIKSWTEKSAKAYDKVKENGNISSPRGLYNKGRTAIPVKSTVGGEWELQTCQEFTEWANNILKRQKHRLIADLKKSLSDGITLVNLLEVLFKEKVGGIQTRPIIRAQRVENIHLCLRFLHGRRIEIQDIDSQQIADGNLRVGLLLITRLRKRFDSKLITSSDSHFVNGSIYSGRHGDMDYVNNNNGFQNPGREGSIHSFVSGASNPSQGMLPDLSNSYDSGQFKKLRSASFTEKPESVLPGGAFGGEDTSDATPERLGDIVSTTQLDSAGVLQHKSGEFQTRQNQSRNASLDVEMSKMLLNNVVDDDDNGSQLHVNNSMNAPQPPSSVEERLKSLLEMPNPGGYTDLGDPQDEGEFLELPPPDASVYFEGEDMLDDEDRLQAMLEDPDNFDDYPKDWDRYISGYVPSHATEKREGPRAQVMLERSPSPNGASRYQEPFFHGPPREHLGPSQGTTAQSQPIPGYSNRSQSQPLPSYLNQSGSIAGVVYSEEEAYQNYSGQEGIHPPAINDASFNERRLPTYQDHMQRRVNGSVQRLKSSGSSPHSSGYDSRGHVSPSMSGPGHMRSKAEPPRNGYHKQRQLERPHSMQRQYFNSRHNQREQDFMNSTFPQNQPNFYENNGTPQEYDPYGAVASTSTIVNYRYPPQTNPPPSSGYPPNWKRRSLGETASDFTQDYEIYSGSSSRSHTPTLPALSPTETPPTSPPVRNKTRAISTDMGRINLNFSKSPNSQQRNREHSRSKRSNEKRPNQRKTAEPKVTVKRTGGKSKRKNLKGSKQDSPESKRSLRALPSLPLHRVQERSEDTDSDVSSDFHPKAELSRLRKEEAATSVKEGNVEEATPPATNAGRDHDGAEIDTLREQLAALENMYKEMLKVVGAKKAEGKISSPRGISGSFKKGPGVARSASKVKPNSYRPSVKQREKDVKAINKRFSRVESHVVTLARSVASLSSELRSQGALVQAVEDLREELDQLQDLHLTQQSELSPLRSPYRMSAPLATKPHSIKKLTKFFGEEPPLLTLFLTELGYDKYSSVFEKAGVGLQELPYLTGEQLEKLGIPLGPRTRIIQESQLMV